MNLAEYATISLIAGVVATAGITIYSSFITKLGWANTDMVRAIGGLYSRSHDSAKSVGMVVHFVAGLIFAALYVFIMHQLLSVDSVFLGVVIGTVIGFVHGFAFSFVMVIIAEHHPLEEFRNTDHRIVAFHLLGHVVYGMLIGAVVGWM